MPITSRQNEKIKEIKSLFRKDSRADLKLYVAEGSKTVREAILSNQPIKRIAVKEKFYGEFVGIADDKTEVLSVTDSVFESITGEVSPEGVLAVIEMPNTAVKKPVGNRCLLLDGISDPGNLGTILRTAAAAGYKDIYLSGCVDPFNPKVIRSSMSGIYFVRLNIGSLEEVFGAIEGYDLISADMSGKNVFDFEKRDKICLAIGSEAQGLSETVRKKSDYTVSIPMEKEMESLNAGVSAGILMYLLK